MKESADASIPLAPPSPGAGVPVERSLALELQKSANRHPAPAAELRAPRSNSDAFCRFPPPRAETEFASKLSTTLVNVRPAAFSQLVIFFWGESRLDFPRSGS